MLQDMRSLILLSLLMLLASCRTHRTSQLEVHEDTRREMALSMVSDSSSLSLSDIRSFSAADFSGITVYFYPPAVDSVLPGQRASPAAIHIDKVSVANSSESSALNKTESTVDETVNLRDESSTDRDEVTESDVKASSPLRWITLLAIALALIFLFMGIRRIRSPT